jgi:glycosyltransferase involved in cell wall biosynthesis
MTTLEAMAAGALCAGFTGIGGLEYATPENGFWVAEDDCEAAADALAEACAIATSGGPELARRLEAGYETARQWSYAAFLRQLEETWMRLAPDARLKSGPLDR